MARAFIHPEKRVTRSPGAILREHFHRRPIAMNGPVTNNLAEAQRKQAELCTLISCMPLAAMFRAK